MPEARFAFALRPRGAAPLETAEDLDLDIYDVIGEFWGEGVGARAVLESLKAAKGAKQINVRINSTGGDAYDGSAIYNLLHQNAAHVVVDIDGIAASAASVIAMAGDEIRMSETALMMIHNPWTITIGEAADLREKAEQLDKLRDALANAYIKRTKRPRKEILEMLDAETWMTAEEALELGFITAITPAKKAAASLRSDLDVSRFKRAPDAVVALAAKRLQRQADHVLEFEVRSETLEELKQIALRLERAAETNPPAPEEPPPQKENDTMSNAHATIAHALGLPVGAAESDCLAAAARMRELEVQICALTGVENSSQAVGAVRALKGAADGAEKLRSELDQLRSDRDRQNFEALITRGQSAPVKLTPATAKLYADKFAAAAKEGRGGEVVEDLRGFLAVAPTIVSPPSAQPAPGVGATSEDVPTWNGKTFWKLEPAERAALYAENPDLYRAMKSARRK
jgi:ATP-dependent Clp protease, protease subunit